MIFVGEGYRDPVPLIQREHDLKGGLQGYLKDLDHLASSYHFTPVLHRLAVVVQTDTINPAEVMHRPLFNAFYAGGLIGIRILEKCVPSEIRESIFKVNLGLPGITNLETGFRDITDIHADTIIANSDIGLSQTENVSELLAEWETEYTHNVYTQHIFNRGAGILLYGMQQAQELVVAKANNIDSMLATSETDLGAWDRAFRQMMGYE